MTEENMSPIVALVKRYIGDVPCSTKLDPEKDWAGYLTNLAKEAKAEGVVSVALKYCEAHLYDLPSLAASLTQKGVPNLMIETSRSGCHRAVEDQVTGIS